MDRKSVLFICIHNSARSQMAEAFLNRLSDRFIAESAGLEPGMLNPMAVKAMAEIGYDISGNSVKGISDMIEKGKKYDCVIAVCDPEAAEQCPIFPGETERLHWQFPDPSAIEGSYEENLAKTRKIRDMILNKIIEFIKQKGEE